MPLTIAWLSAGRLYLKEGESAGREVVSRFGEEMKARALREGERSSWKFRESSKGGIFGSGMLWGGRGSQEIALVPPRITGVVRPPDKDSFYYFLETEVVGGLFHYDRLQNEERRIFHKEGFRAKDPDFHAGAGLFAFSLPFPNGTSGISLADAEGRNLQRLTEGDSVDEAPSWLPATAPALVYHSAGIGRSSTGEPVGLGPCSLHRIDLAARRAETLIEDRGFDFLQPHGTEAGDLLYIRRPYESIHGRPPSGLTILKDVLLFPWNVGKAILSFLNAFSLAFSQKPLMTSGGPKLEGPEFHKLLIRGRAVDARKALRNFKGDGEAPSLVPSDWELMRRSSKGETKTLARGVLAFDAAPDGTVVYTNGTGVFTLDAEDRPRRIEKGSLIEQVTLLEK